MAAIFFFVELVTARPPKSVTIKAMNVRNKSKEAPGEKKMAAAHLCKIIGSSKH